MIALAAALYALAHVAILTPPAIGLYVVARMWARK